MPSFASRNQSGALYVASESISGWKMGALCAGSFAAMPAATVIAAKSLRVSFIFTSPCG
jgi:hypothetical protein